jgi:hypothetical protein
MPDDSLRRGQVEGAGKVGHGKIPDVLTEHDSSCLLCLQALAK